jgi:Fe-S-cluster containining protein
MRMSAVVEVLVSVLTNICPWESLPTGQTLRFRRTMLLGMTPRCTRLGNNKLCSIKSTCPKTCMPYDRETVKAHSP